MKLLKLFTPITINQLVIQNRIVMPAMALFFTDSYAFNDRFRRFYRQRANGGVGLMFIGPVAIDRVGSTPRMLGLFDDGQMEAFKLFNEEIHATTAAKIGIQLMHQGRYAIGKETGQTPVAPSAVFNPLTGETPVQMTIEDIQSVKKAFVDSARRAKQANFDFIELIAGGGYLIAQFLSAVTNHRKDEYGGSFENRMRFGLEIIKAVRHALGKDTCLGIRVSGNDFMENGNTGSEAAVFCSEAVKAGVDAVNVTGGWHETRVPQITSDVPEGAFLYLSKAIREKVNVPVFASNRLGNPFLAEKALRAGVADMICWGRPLIADPELPQKIIEGRMDEIVPCISCNQGCLDAIFSKTPVCCTVNPRVGREKELSYQSQKKPKKILVAGGGPAGMEFALNAGRMGHSIILFEASGRLGGQLNLINSVPGKQSYANAAESLEKRLKHTNVQVRLHTELTPQIVKQHHADLVVIATGASPAKPEIQGIGLPHVVNARDVLNGAVADIGKQVVIIGGGATGCETAVMICDLSIPSADAVAFLAFQNAEPIDRLQQMLYQSNHRITIIEIGPRIASNMGASSRWPLLKRMKLLSVNLRAQTKTLRIEKDGVIVESHDLQERIPADTVVIAAGSRPVNALEASLKNISVKTVTIGDAKAPRRILEAVSEGFDAAMKI
jgi:2,4-dienoyl-CoA reductase (NADPH2)